MFNLVTTGIDGVVVIVDAADVRVLNVEVNCGREVITESPSFGTLMVSLGTTDGEGELMIEAEDEDDEIGEDSNELILVSLEQLSSEEAAAAGFGGIGLIVSLGIGTSEGSRGTEGGGLGIGFIVSLGMVDVMLEC